MIYVLLAVMMSMASPALAFNEPDSFRGVKWGTPRQEAMAILEKNGEQPKCDAPMICRSRVTIGNIGITMLYVFDVGDLFERASFSFHPTNYMALREIFVGRYGEPSETKEQATQNRMGASFTNETTTWRGEQVVISLSRYGSRIDQGSAVIVLKSALERAAAERQKGIQKGKGDL